MGDKLIYEWYETLHDADAWSEDDGAVLWWSFPVAEAPYCGTPLDFDFDPNIYTHWTRIVRNNVIADWHKEKYGQA